MPSIRLMMFARWPAAAGQALQCLKTRYFSKSAAAFVNKKRIMKLVKKSKKKFYLPGNTAPQLGLNLGGTTAAGKSRGHTARLQILNAVLFKNMLDVVQSNMISDELEAAKVEILRVQMAGDFSGCRVFWQATGNLEEDIKIQDILNKHAGPVRHKLTQLRLIGFLPKLVFVKDRSAANVAEIERLLASVDLGSDEEEMADPPPQHGTLEYIGKSHPGREAEMDLFGLNHQDLNRQIMQFRKKQLNVSVPAVDRKDYKNFKLKKMKRKSTDNVDFEYEWDSDEEIESDTDKWQDDFSDYEDLEQPKDR